MPGRFRSWLTSSLTSSLTSRLTTTGRTLRSSAARHASRLAPVGRRTWGVVRKVSGNHPAIASVCAVLALVVAIGAWRFPPGADPPAPRDGPAADASPATSSADPALDVVPAVNPVRAVRAANGDDTFIFDRPIEALPPPPEGYAADREIGAGWAHANGGTDAEVTFVELVIQGRGTRSVVLTDLHIEVQHRDPPPAKTAVDLTESGDGVDGRNADVDLDETAPRLTKTYNYTDGKPWSFPLRVSDEAVEVIYLWVHTTTCDCQWIANLHFVADGKAQMIEINDDGKPFRTVSTTNCTRYGVDQTGFVPLPR